MTGSVRIHAEAMVNGQRQRRIEMVAYTGVAMRLPGIPLPVVVDLAGLSIGASARPILIQHRNDAENTLGQTTAVRVMPPDLVLVEGIKTGTSATAERVLANNDAGHRYQASIGADVLESETIAAGRAVKVNGKVFSGPLIVARKTYLGEISFCNLGADDGTSARIAAMAAEGYAMKTFEQWLAARGLKAEGLTDEQKAALLADFKTIQASADAGAGDDAGAGGDDDQSGQDAGGADGALDNIRGQIAAEHKRVASITRICASADKLTGDLQGEDLAAKAIEAGWTADQTELYVLRHRRPRIVPGLRNEGGDVGTKVLQCAALQASGMSGLEKQFDSQTLEQAHSKFRGRIGLKRILLEAAWANGCQERFLDAGNIEDVLSHGFNRNGRIQAEFSTISLPGILSNTANKFLVEGFLSVNQAWRQIAGKRPANDFKTMTIYRLTSDMMFEKVGADGRLSHGKLGEASYTNKVNTYGKITGISRQDIINDDMGALTAVPRHLGVGFGRSFNKVFWTEFMDNASFFSSGNKNYISGATTVLDLVGLPQAVQLFREQTDESGQPVDFEPSILLVPPALELAADQIYRSSNLAVGGGSSKAQVPTANTYMNKYRPVVAPYLSNSAYTGYSSLAWYLLCDPGTLAVIEAAFLNGQENPTIETAQADFSTLGIDMRGFGDFGIAKQEPRAGVKSKGAA